MEQFEKRFEQENFESVNAEASLTVNRHAGSIHKSDYLMIKGRPCKVSDVSTFQPGKHGKTKCHFVGNDIFTGRKYEELIQTHHNADVPVTSRNEYQVINLSDDGFVAMMQVEAPYKTRSDIKCPEHEKPDVAARIKKLFAEEQEFSVIVLGACNKEIIIDVKILNATS